MSFTATGKWVARRPGTALDNGAILIAVRKVSSNESVILAVRPDVPHDAYVTWRMDLLSGETYWGNYFSSFEAALANYKER